MQRQSAWGLVDLPNTTDPDDWQRISGKKGERIVYIRTLVTRNSSSASRAIDTEDATSSASSAVASLPRADSHCTKGRCLMTC